MEKDINVYEIKDENTTKNRICILEQAKVYVKVIENLMEEMTDKREDRIFAHLRDKGCYQDR